MKKPVCAMYAIFVSTFVLVDSSLAVEPADVLQRGEYLTRIMDCGGCHTPWMLGPSGPEPDISRLLSGHPQDAQLPPPPLLPAGPWNAVSAGNSAWSGPWGISYSSNLTPDNETGIGAWNEKMFAGSMRSGKHAGIGRELLPPMPKYPELTDEDLAAVFAYLKSLPPISNRVPPPAPPSTK